MASNKHLGTRSDQTRVERICDAFLTRRERKCEYLLEYLGEECVLVLDLRGLTIQFIFPKCISCELNNWAPELGIWEEGDFYIRD